MRARTRPTLPLSSSSTSRKTSATVAVRLSSWVRSPRTVRTRTPCAASSSDRALAACSSLLPYASTQSKPFAASRCAVASPMPPEPPVMMATVAASAEQCTAAARRARPSRGSGATNADTLHASGRRSASRILQRVRALLASLSSAARGSTRGRTGLGADHKRHPSPYTSPRRAAVRSRGITRERRQTLPSSLAPRRRRHCRKEQG